MKKLSIAFLAIAVSCAAFGQAPAPAKKVASKMAYCAVLGETHKVDVASATKNKMFADYKGKRYYFCCGGCPEAFKKDPAKYAKGKAGFPIPNVKKTKKA